MYLEKVKNAGGSLGKAAKRPNSSYRLGAVLYILCLVFIFTGCATPQDIGRMQWDLNKLRSEVRDIKQKSRTLESQIPGQEGQFNKHIKELKEEQKSTSKAVSDLLMKVQSLTTEFQILTGRFEEARYFSEKSSKELTESKDILIAQVKELEVTVNKLKERLDRLEAAEPQTEKQKPAKYTKKAEEPKKEIKDVYVEAYTTLKANKFEEARKKFLSLLENYSENEYSDNARFWIGESYYKEKNYEEAILAYDELLKKNPKSDKVPGAMLKQGLAFYELKDKNTGRIILENLIEKFPDSEQAKLAKKKIRKSIPPKKK